MEELIPKVFSRLNMVEFEMKLIKSQSRSIKEKFFYLGVDFENI